MKEEEECGARAIMSKLGEPVQLRRGKRFHKLIQREWLKTAKDGYPRPERFIKKISGNYGRVDILVEQLGKEMVSVVEVKATDWERIKPQNLQRNLRRQIKQVWKYVDSQLDVYGFRVCPGIIFPKLPKDPKRLNIIEAAFNSGGIQVIWHNEFVKNLKARMAQKA